MVQGFAQKERSPVALSRGNDTVVGADGFDRVRVRVALSPESRVALVSHDMNVLTTHLGAVVAVARESIFARVDAVLDFLESVHTLPMVRVYIKIVAPWCKAILKSRIATPQRDASDDVTKGILVVAREVAVNFGLVATGADRVTEAVLSESFRQEAIRYLHITTHVPRVYKDCCTMVQDSSQKKRGC
jgi:hypothetical protein